MYYEDKEVFGDSMGVIYMSFRMCMGNLGVIGSHLYEVKKFQVNGLTLQRLLLIKLSKESTTNTISSKPSRKII